MLRFFRARTSIILLLVGASVLTSGCLTRRADRDAAPDYTERPVEVLYGLAGAFLDGGAFRDSILYFQEVERQHPYSDWARRAILMEAFANYRAGDYPAAIADAERFIQLYPGNPGASYAYYLKAMCFYEQIVDVGRDQGTTELAQAALREVVTRFPGSDYAADARLKLDRVDDHLAGKEMTVGRFYLRNGDTIAAIGRFKNVLDRYQTTSHAPEALYRMVEGYVTLGVMDEATRNAAVLGENFPGSDWYSDAYGLMTDRGLQPAIAPTETRRLRNLFGLIPSGSESPALERSNASPPPQN